MLQHEFEERTHVKVSQEEYLAIEVIYNHCEVDKDIFCNLWCKMHPKRVLESIRKEKERMKADALKDKVWDLYERKNTCDSRIFCELANNYFSKRDQHTLELIGITLERDFSGYLRNKFAYEVIGEIRKFLFHGNK